MQQGRRSAGIGGAACSGTSLPARVEGREVTLSGTVNSRFEKRHAEDIADQWGLSKEQLDEYSLRSHEHQGVADVERVLFG